MPERDILNIAEAIKAAGARFRPAGREVLDFQVGGKRLGYDVNAMTLALDGAPGESSPASCFRPDFPHPGVRDHVHHLVLYLTRRCNLRCGYCFVRNAEQGRSARMTSATARRALELLLPTHRSVTIAWPERMQRWKRLNMSVEP